MNLPASFTSKVRESTCHVWVGATNSRGYGIVKSDGSLQLAHRIVFEATYGPIPDGYVIDHLCRVRNCVNPAHLQAVTQSENNRRGRAARTLSAGDYCINGHRIAGDADLYQRANGLTECRECRRAEKHARRAGGSRPTVQRTAEKVRRAVDLADTA